MAANVENLNDCIQLLTQMSGSKISLPNNFSQQSKFLSLKPQEKYFLLTALIDGVTCMFVVSCDLYYFY